MKYLVSVIAKILMLPIAVVFFVPAYLAFIIHPDYRRFQYKMDY